VFCFQPQKSKLPPNIRPPPNKEEEKPTDSNNESGGGGGDVDDVNPGQTEEEIREVISIKKRSLLAPRIVQTH
jgi:hypothetical protein